MLSGTDSKINTIVMKTILPRLLAVIVATSAIQVDALAYGTRNHAAIAYIAEQYLTPRARRAVRDIFHGESITQYASSPDLHKATMLIEVDSSECVFTDGKPCLRGPEGKAFSYGTKFRVDDRGRIWSTVAHGWLADNDSRVRMVPKGDCIWAIHHYEAVLRSTDATEEQRHEALEMIVHQVGDLHCPCHVHYLDGRDRNDLKFPVVFRRNKVRYHTFWDETFLVAVFPGGMTDMAYYADPLMNGSLDRREAMRQFRQIQQGSVEEWAEDLSSRLEMVMAVKEGDTITAAQVDEFSKLGREMIRRAGYRLAAMLNSIFG